MKETVSRREMFERMGLYGVSTLGLMSLSHEECASSETKQKSRSPKLRTFPLLEAHRGNSAYAPENTMIAIEQAIENGADRVEIDVWSTRDNHAVVIHDETVDRTTDGSGEVRQMDVNEIKKLDAGSWKGEKFKGQNVPLLKEVLKLAKGKVMIDIDLKEPRAIKPMVRDIRDANMLQDVIITGTSREDILAVREVEPRLPVFFERSDELTVLFEAGEKEKMIIHAIESALELQSPGFNFNHNWITPELIRAAHLRCLYVMAWTVNEPKRMAQLIEWGVDAVMTDDPALFLKILDQEHLAHGM